MTTGIERRALLCLFRNHPSTTPGERYGWSSAGLAAERRETLLRWSASLSDPDLLLMRNLGPASLEWIRRAAAEHHIHRFECSCGKIATDRRDTLAEVRRWVESIGQTNLATGRRIGKADALVVIDRMTVEP